MSAFFNKILDFQKRKEVYVIAELGSNWKTRADLMNAVTLAKACGADAIKFQYFTKSELFGPKPEIDREFPLNQLKEKADAHQVDLLCSAFSPEGLREVDKFVPAHKIASSEMAHVRLLDEAKKARKPVILSTGGYFATDIKRTLEYLRDNGDGTMNQNFPLILMHCNHAYPARHTNLKKFEELKTMAQVIGFSDHTTSIDLVPTHFKSLGVSVYEKHFNPFNFSTTPDATHSLDVDEFKCMVSYLRGAPNDFNEENEARLIHVRRIIALKDIKPGDRLIEGENIGIFRAQRVDAKGANPFALTRLEGKPSTKEIKRGEGVSLMDVQ